ncbi:SLAM family member 5-like [Thamnophis elegans]|uniref:SLAM family member 5-like n=1 Tax=Thamnophis elegans TaxID=35005 RepID=UPI001376E6ED|nr:SLAM family member 5-like [Thamnophis elegans]
MCHKIVLRLCFSVLFLRAGTSGAKELIGILGESVTFRVETPPPFETISLNKIVNSNPRNIALMTFKELSCPILFLHPDFQKRLNISSDCRNLHLGPLKKEDTGRYSVTIVLPTKKTADESFDLQVFKRLVDSELKVTCTPEGTGNRTWQLTCSTGTWEDRVNISWTSSAQSTGPTPGSSVIRFVSQELDATCRAENPVSQASRTVSLKEVCAEERPGTEDPQVNEDGTKKTGWIVGVIVLVIIILLIVIICVLYVWRRKAAKGSGRFTTNTDTESSSRSGSALIGGQPKETRKKTNQSARKAAKQNQELPHTIYTSVQHPKQNHLQTDDEKMGQHSHQNQAEKTIYSEITKSEEGEDSEMKTIYETVQKPLPIKYSGMSAFV